MSRVRANGRLIQCDSWYYFPQICRVHPEMQLGAKYQTVNSALRAQLIAAAECDREGTIQVRGGRVDMDIGDVT